MMNAARMFGIFKSLLRHVELLFHNRLRFVDFCRVKLGESSQLPYCCITNGRHIWYYPLDVFLSTI